MKTITIAWFILLITTPSYGQSDRATFLRAINEVENPTNSRRPGRHGELGPYQFKAKVWAQYSNTSFALANDRKMADFVAIAHYDWLCHALGAAVSDYNLAAAWNAGIGSVASKNLTYTARDYAQRVANICQANRLAMR